MYFSFLCADKLNNIYAKSLKYCAHGIFFFTVLHAGDETILYAHSATSLLLCLQQKYQGDTVLSDRLVMLSPMFGNYSTCAVQFEDESHIC